MRDLHYCILDSRDLSNLNFSQVLENNINTVRLNNDESLGIVHWVGDKVPDYIKQEGFYILNHEEALKQTREASWNDE